MNKNTDYVKPPSGSLFGQIIAPRGNRLAIVFGNEAPGGRCPYHASQCNHCDIGEGEGVRFTSDMNSKRLSFFEDYFSEEFKTLNHLIVYNYGSTLNEAEMSNETLTSILEFVYTQSSIKRISFDSRERFITADKIKYMVSKTREDQVVAVTIGLESISEDVRIKNLNKHITKQQVEEVYRALSTQNPRTAVDINVLFQAPGVVGREAVNEALNTVKFGLELMQKYQVSTDFNFHPYYPSIKGTNTFPDHPRAKLQDAIKAMILIIREIKKYDIDSKLFVGWNDEGHDLEPGVRNKKLMLYDPAFTAFNTSQNEKDLII